MGIVEPTEQTAKTFTLVYRAYHPLFTTVIRKQLHNNTIHITIQ